MFTDLFIRRLRIIEPYNFRISDPGPVYYISIGFFSVVCFRLLFLLYSLVKNTEGIRRKQAQYFLITHILLVFAGLEYFIGVLDLITFPSLNDYVIVLYFIIFAYAIIKYQVMDIQTIIHKTAAWLTVSSLVAVPLFGIFYLQHHSIRNLSQRMERLVNDLLEYARVGQGKGVSVG